MNSIYMSNLLTLVVALVLTTGCASVFDNPTRAVKIDSTPQNAFYRIVDHEGEEVANGTTPDVVTLPSYKKHSLGGARYTVNFDSPNYEPHTNELKAKVSPWYWVNFIMSVPGLVGILLVDPFTGAMFRLPSKTSVVLVPNVDNAEQSTTVIELAQ